MERRIGGSSAGEHHSSGGLSCRPPTPDAREVTPPPVLSRRRALLATGAAVVTGRLLGPGIASAAEPTRAPARTSSATTRSAPPAPPSSGRQQAARPQASPLLMASRATYGPTSALMAELERIGPDRWLEAQLAPAALPDPRGDLVRSRYPRLAWTIPQARAGMPRSNWELMWELGQSTIGLAAWSSRQLLEVMTEFWSNHLNVTSPSSDVWDNRADYDRTVIRRHALGRFADMLVASARHPAMLRYLDNATSTKAAPNENYGRELLELHTVGVEAGYTETMIRDSTRIMTGFGVDSATGLFRYDPKAHATGAVKVLGFSAANAAPDGQALGVSYLNYLARHPATARRIATKLAQRFVADNPPTALVDRLAAQYLAADTAIAPVLRSLFTSTTFAESAGAKVRRPYEDLIATLRTLDIGPPPTTADPWTKGLYALYWLSNDMGMPPLAWHPPNGYPDVAGAWQSASGTLARWNTHMALAAGWWPKTTMLTYPGLRSLLPATLPRTYGEFVVALGTRLLHQPVTAAELAPVLGFLDRRASDPLRAKDPAVTWRLPYVVALILDSPRFAVR